MTNIIKLTIGIKNTYPNSSNLATMVLSRYMNNLLFKTRNSMPVRSIHLLSEITKPQIELSDNNCELDATSYDLSTVTPYHPKTFNLAAYVNHSDLLQNLIHLNVNLSRLEKKPHVVDKILKLTCDDLKKHIFFITNFVQEEDLGHYLTRNPLILCESLQDLEVRVHYLQSKHFSERQISRIIQHNSYWLMFSTQRIDRRLGFYQKKFDLCGDEVRCFATKQPKLITYNLHHVNTNTFVIKEEMGFKDRELKKLLLDKPKLWMLHQKSLTERFNLLHNTIKVPHSTLLLHPEVLFCRSFKIKQRYLFLQKLGRAQFDPKKENYVPIMALAEESDIYFCKTYAKCNINDFNVFLKTL